MPVAERKHIRPSGRQSGRSWAAGADGVGASDTDAWPIPSRDLSQLIGSIYDCTLDPSRWEETLKEIMELTFAESIILSLNDLRNDRPLIEKSVGWGQHGLLERRKHIPEIHARLSEWFACEPCPDAPYVCSRELSADYLERSPYVRHCLKPRGIIDVMHQFLVHTPSHFSELVVARHERNGLITGREVEILALLLPHIRRAVTISKVLDARTIEKEHMAEALDALRCGVVITDGEAGILYANREAEHLLRNGDVLNSTDGALGVRMRAAARELRRAIYLAAEDETALGKIGAAIRLTEREVAPVFAHVLPMKGGDLRARLQTRAVAAIFIGGLVPMALDLTLAETRDYLRSEFRLTDGEADVAVEIMKGDGRAAVAARLGIAVTTVRTHLSHIYEKTGVNRQAELGRLLMQGKQEITS